MPDLTVHIKYDYANELQISVSDLISDWMFGIPLKDSKGYQYSYDSIRKKILFAQSLLSTLLCLKMVPTVIEDIQDYIAEEFMNWGYVKFAYPINEIIYDAEGKGLKGKFSDYSVVQFPREWMSFKVGQRSIGLVPGMTGSGSMVMTASGTVYSQLVRGNRNIPNFWHLTYKTGYTTLPYDVEAVIAKLAVVAIFGVVGDVIRPVGISSQSLSIDGLSQSISTTLNSQGNLLSPRVNQYFKELFGDNMRDGEIEILINNKRGIIFETL